MAECTPQSDWVSDPQGWTPLICAFKPTPFALGREDNVNALMLEFRKR